MLNHNGCDAYRLIDTAIAVLPEQGARLHLTIVNNRHRSRHLRRRIHSYCEQHSGDNGVGVRTCAGDGRRGGCSTPRARRQGQPTWSSKRGN